MSSPTEKTCSKCGDTKPIVAFQRRAETGRGWRSQCRECRRARDRKSGQHARGMVRNGAGFDPPHRPSQSSCKVCEDMPWRRESPWCLGCGEAYRPERIERGEVIGSSAALMVEAGW